MLDRMTFSEIQVADHVSEVRCTPAIWVSSALALLTAASSAGGLFLPSIYLQETLPWATQLRGGDAVTLLIVAPVLLVSAALSRRGAIPARMVWQGTLLLLLYNFAIYAFAVHFNGLFLVYCGVLGLSFYSLLNSLLSHPSQEIADRYGPRAPVKTMAVVFFLLALAFAAQGLREIVPALLAGRPPGIVSDCGLLSYPVHVLDLSLFLPAYAITGVLLLRRRPRALAFAPVLMVFSLLMTATVAGLMAAMALEGLANDYFAAVIFLAVALGCAVLLGRYFRGGAAREGK
jgi:hypothetical protein